MAYREVTMVEVREVLRLWLQGQAKKKIAAALRMDPKTVRSYLAAAERQGLARGQRADALTDDFMLKLMAALRPATAGRPHGQSWAACADQREFIERMLRQRVRLSKIRRLLHRQGVDVPYATLHRFAVVELSFGRGAPTVAVADGDPGVELQVDTGWMTLLEPDEHGRRRRIRAWIFTPSLSRYRFVYPCFEESTASAIEACEAAWAFYGGVFQVLVPDCTKAIVDDADPLRPRPVIAFLEYAQARGFAVDPARARHPKDKARVERSVRDVRDDCFAGETLHGLDDARDRATHWSANEYGMRRHTRTQRMPREHFESVEKAALFPAPTAPYDVPLWAEPKVARDQYAQVARALYSLPTRFVGKVLRARADRNLVRFYLGGELVKTHVRRPPGGRATDPADFPVERHAYAMRDVEYLAKQAEARGAAVGRFARALLDAPLPWARMRQVRALVRLCDKYGDARVEETCARALDADLVDLHRLERMVERAVPAAAATKRHTTTPAPARFLRAASDYALPLACVRVAITDEEDRHD